MAASPGAAKGEIVFTAPDAVAAAADGRAVILVRQFTEADDVAGFHAAKGILTAEGGKASHAALVARGMGRPAVTGAAELDIDLHARELRVGEHVLHDGDLIAIDGSTGQITVDDVPLVTPGVDARFERVLGWCDELRTLGVRANADSPEDARRASEFGAEGIGLCRTEHMFMATDRLPKMQRMVMAEDEAGRRAALDELLPLQQADFEGLFEAMTGLPVAIRLLDPPLHEFLPDRDELVERIAEARLRDKPELGELEHELERVRSLEEGNPMLGTRGVRLGLFHPEIYEMQVRAIFRATASVRERTGEAPHLEIMIPLVAYASELEQARELVLRVAAEEGFEPGRRLHRRHHDRAAPRMLRGRRHRTPRRVLLVRHQRPHADRTRLLARRHRGPDHPLLHGSRHRGPLPVRVDRRGRRGGARAHGRRARQGREAAARGRDLRRARRRPRLDPVLPSRRDSTT